MLPSTSLKMLLSLSAGEWGAAVEEAVSNGLPRGEAHDLCECFKMHSIDVAQAYIRASWPPGHPDLYMELPSLDGSNLVMNILRKCHVCFMGYRAPDVCGSII